MGDWFDDFNEWIEKAEGTHKVLLGVAVFFVSRWLYDSFKESRENSIQLPSSDSSSYSKTIPLSTRGNAGVYQTLDIMAQLVRRDAASEYLRRFALDLVWGCGGHDADCEIRACFEFARDAITYRRDPHSVERVSDAKRTIESGVGDCDDKCVLLCSLLAVIGYRTRFVVCGFRRNSHSHVYCEVLSKRGWIALDPTPENALMGWQQNHAPYREIYEIFT